MRRAGNLLILAGILLLASLAFGQHRNEQKTEALIRQFEQIPFEELQETEELLKTEELQDASAGAEQVQALTRSVLEEYAAESIEAIIEIPSIELKAPIVEGTEKQHLSHAVGRLIQSGKWGMEGDNVALAGHRSKLYGQFFNRLDELEEGDRILITSRKLKMEYIVTQKKVVKPTEVEVIQPIPGQTMLTLITCHPFRSNKKRLIISAERVDDLSVMKS